MIEQEARRLAEVVAANAPEGWELARTSGDAGGFGDGVSKISTWPGGRVGRGRIPPDLTAQGKTVLEELQRFPGWHTPWFEFSCRPSGDFEMVAASDSFIGLSNGEGGFQALLDRGHLPPQPGSRQEGGTAAPAGDPRLAAARFREYLDRRAAILDEPDSLPQPAAPAAIDEAERRIGCTLPADLRALYSIADGDDPQSDDLERGALFGGLWMSLDELVAAHELLREPGWFEWDLSWFSAVSDPHPPETIRRCTMHPAWIPFADNEDFTYLAVDMSPARNGRPGQVIRIGYPYNDEPVYIADSVTALLAHYLDHLDRETYKQSGDLHFPDPELESPGPRQVGSAFGTAASPATQEVVIGPGDEPVRDLSALAAAVNLRTLTSAHPVADLAPLRTLPVECVRVTLDGGDLTPLEGHRQLASLQLGTAGPTGIAPLRSVGGLHGLDLSRADVPDLHVLAGLPRLRYLKLTARQWTTLLDEAGTPPGLAVAALAERNARLADARAWATRVGLDPADSVRITGTFGSGGG
ncbi:hypothetical protein GCM10027570_52650 [Streptomonospora sediminis]